MLFVGFQELPSVWHVIVEQQIAVRLAALESPPMTWGFHGRSSGSARIVQKALTNCRPFVSSRLQRCPDFREGIVEPPQAMGRPRIPLRDAIFAACFKVYSTFSGRRFMT